MIEKRLRQFPPLVVRLLARHPGRRGSQQRVMTDAEIARRSKGKLAEAHVACLSRATSWDDIPVGQMIAFTKACGVDFDSRRAMMVHTKYLRRNIKQNLGPAFAYLRKDDQWESRWKPMILTAYSLATTT